MYIQLSKIRVEYIYEILCRSLDVLLWPVELHLKDII